MTALRTRRVKYAWVAVSVFVLAAMYAAPLAGALRLPALSSSSPTALPPLAIPSVTPPLLRVPAVRRLAPLPALPKQVAPAQQQAPAATRAPVAQHARRQRVPVVTDVHSQVAPAPKQSAAAGDPYANVPVVSDEIGVITALPASA